MRLWILSDLHLDVVPWAPPTIPDADVAVVAGDVGEGVAASIEWLARTVRPHMRVVFIAGNHEHYHSILPEEVARGRVVAAALGIDYLEDEATWIGGVAFAGCTLWTDYRVDGDAPDRVAAAMDAALLRMADHRLILRTRRPRPEPFLPRDAAATHHASCVRLEALSRSDAWRASSARIVVTHHAPVAESLDPRFVGSPLNPAFASRLDGLVSCLGADLWVHGHTHASLDHVAGRTRVLCNPKGYGAENRRFDPALVIDVPG
ncbi:metallophosphoesterase [Methylobacterium mesophilicum]